MTERIPVLFDTDIGTDIDDVMCLTYLLHQPRCELVGVTTVTGEPQQRAMLVDALCQAAGRDRVPIHSGSHHTIRGEVIQPRCRQAEILPRWPHRTDFAPNTAVEFMRQTIRSRPGEIVLLAVGPMTNVGLLMATDPEIASMLRGLVLMCGQFTTGGPGAREWNALGDAYATALVYRAGVEPHISIGLDVTMQCALSVEACRKQMAANHLAVARDAAEVWFRQRNRIIFHDPLAAAIIFEPDLCCYEEGLVTVETVSEPLLGLTLWNSKSEIKPHRIATEVDAERFLAHYFAVVSPE